MYTRNRLIAAILTASLIVSAKPILAFSAENTEEEQTVQTETVEEQPSVENENNSSEQEIAEDDGEASALVDEQIVSNEDNVEPEGSSGQTLIEEDENTPEEVIIDQAEGVEEGEVTVADTESGSEMDSVTEPGITEETTPVTREIAETLEEKITYKDFELGDNDALFEDYANRLFYGEPARKNMLRGTKSTGARLTGQDAVVYSYLRTAVSEIAAGERDSAIINIPLEALGIDPEKRYYAEDLGLSYIYRETESGGDDWNTEVDSAMMKFFTFDIDRVMNCLFADCPYELYWGRGYSYPTVLGIESNAEGRESEGVFNWVGYATFKTNYTFVSISVESKYRVSNDETGYAVDTSKTSAAASSAENAHNVIAGASSLPDDYDKLAYYKDKICEFVKYDREAADQSDTYIDRGPWSLIYVFDNDPDTNVVCEGYSEAFQYLCDLTDFQHDEICAYSVTGDLDGGTGAGGHKWNIVHMEDGYNYIADITNSDDGSWGEGGDLFLKGMNGNVNDGYSKDNGNTTIKFTYDEETRSIYSDRELLLSAKDYRDNEPLTVDSIANPSGVNLMLTDKIGFRIHVKVKSPYVEATDYIQFEYEGTPVKQTIAEAVAEYKNEEDTDKYDLVYVFELPLTTSEMTEEVSFKMVIDGEEGTTKTYSVRSYADYLLEEGDAATKAMVESMLHYGRFSQEYFDYKTDELADADITVPDYSTLPDLSSYQYSYSKESESYGFALHSATLYLDSVISVRFYYTLEDGKELSDFDVKVLDGQGSEVKYETDYNNERGMYYITIKDIEPLDLAKLYHVTVADKVSGNKITELSYGPLSYCNSKLSNPSSTEKVKNLCASIYYYYEAAANYNSQNSGN